MLPQFNNAGSTGNGTPITAPGTFYTIKCPLYGAANMPAGAAGLPMFDQCSYYFAVGAGVTAGTITFQEMGTDGITFRNLAFPAPITLTASTNYSNSFSGPFHGLQIVVAALAGGNITYGELKATVREAG